MSLRSYTDSMRDKLEQLKRLLEDILEDMRPDDTPTDRSSQPTIVRPDFDSLKSLLVSELWPEAVFSAQIADDNSEEDKDERAQGIADIMLPPLVGKRFLDFGCGEGHVAKHVAKEASSSVGYDLQKSARSRLPWEIKQDGFLLTTDFDKVLSEGPFDMILLYDVVDHAEGSTPSDMLAKAASAMASDGKIFLRCHPWCGRHGGHIYRKFNKAFAHLVFHPDELKILGSPIDYNARVLRPLKTYGEIIDAAGLVNDVEPEIDNQEVEDFFRDTPLVRDRILKVWGVDKWEHDPPSFQMSQCFVDYVLKKSL